MPCPKCKNNKFHLVLEKVKAEDEETGEEEYVEMWSVRCTNCRYSNTYLDADATAYLEIEKLYIKQELAKIRKRKQKRYLA
jgi:Zn finger protein HypA/HybF involved in hydrogenase expression